MSGQRQHHKAGPAGATLAGLSQFERDRMARIAQIQAKLAECMDGVQIDSLERQPKKPRVTVARKPKISLIPSDCRRSSRISNKPAPAYFLKEDIPESSSCRSQSGVGANGRRCHGFSDTADCGTHDPYMVKPLGWKVVCGSASLAAAERATDAALALQRELAKQNRPAVVKLMSASQVSGGFWMQLPLDIIPHYGSNKRDLTLHCTDKAHEGPSSFLYAIKGSSSKWPVVYLPKTSYGEFSGGSGLSGGWRGFSIDQRLFPNDTVVFEVLDQDADTVTAVAGSTDGAAAATKVSVKPHARLHMRAHLFRAAAYKEKDASTGTIAAASVNLDVVRASAQHVSEANEAGASAVAGDNSRADSGIDGDSEAGQTSGIAAADEMQSDHRLQIARQASICSSSFGDPAPSFTGAKQCHDGVAVAAQGLVDRGTLQAADAHNFANNKPNRKRAATAAKSSGKRQAGGKQQQAAVGKQAPAATSAAGLPSRVASKQLVAKPAEPHKFVLPATQQEIESDAAGGPFWVKNIQAHRVHPQTRVDEFLVRWWYFGAWWDTWEPEQNLDNQPGTYDWRGGKKAIPEKYRIN